MNPLTIAEQAEGSVIFNLSAALYGKIEIKNGVPVQGNFDTYRMVRLAQAPKIDIHLLASGGKVWGGAGEPAADRSRCGRERNLRRDRQAHPQACRSWTTICHRAPPDRIVDVVRPRKLSSLAAICVPLCATTSAWRPRPIEMKTKIYRADHMHRMKLFAATLFMLGSASFAVAQESPQQERAAGSSPVRNDHTACQQRRIRRPRRRLHRMPFGAGRQGVCRRPQKWERRWARSYSINLTPDPDTGIGKYSYEDFDRAVRGGVAKDGRHLYPAMPYPSLCQDHRRRHAPALRLLHERGAAGQCRE